MDEPAMSSTETTEVDFLIETDSRILDQVRKDLNQEYVRLMSRALQAGRGPEQGGAASRAAPDSGEKTVAAAGSSNVREE
jgi:hypothetical protein